MPMSLTMARIVLGVLAVGFAFLAGRAGWRVYNGTARMSRAVGWSFRTLAALLGTLWSGRTDRISATVLALSLGAAALGAYLESRPRKEPEDLSSQIVPKD
jgi:hypothetical protein